MSGALRAGTHKNGGESMPNMTNREKQWAVAALILVVYHLWRAEYAASIIIPLITLALYSAESAVVRAWNRHAEKGKK